MQPVVCEGGHVLQYEGEGKGPLSQDTFLVLSLLCDYLTDTASAEISPPVNAGDDPF